MTLYFYTGLKKLPNYIKYKISIEKMSEIKILFKGFDCEALRLPKQDSKSKKRRSIVFEIRIVTSN